jgi:hypothetical protein
MPKPNLSEDDAPLYVLGGLSVAERREFDAMLAESARLRALVRDLEEGAVALTLTVAPKRPPHAVWQQIEKALAKEGTVTGGVSSYWTQWWRWGWAAAAACLVGWLLYAFSVNRPHSVTLAAGANSRTDAREQWVSTPPVRAPMQNQIDRRTDEAAAAQSSATSQGREIAALRRQVVELRRQMTNLSHSLADEEASLAESNRFKVSATLDSGETEATPNKPAPELQLAIFLAMSRELGWASPGDTNAIFDASIVQFVDLRSVTNAPASEPIPIGADTGNAQTQSAPAPGTNSLAIPSVATQNGILIAIGPSIAPAGSQITVSTGTDQGLQTTNFNTGEGPSVIAVPTGGASLIISRAGSGGSSVVQYYIPGTNQP